MLPIVSLFFFMVAIIFSSVCSLHDVKNHVLPVRSEVIVLSFVHFRRAYSSFNSS